MLLFRKEVGMKNKDIKLTGLTMIAMLSLFLLAGCGRNDTAATNSDTGKTLKENSTEIDTGNTQSQTETEKTRIIKTEQGDVEIPANPVRIVIQSYVGDLLSMGVKPIGGDMDPALFDGLLDGTDYKRLENFEPETIMGLEPDLIIVLQSYKEVDYDKLSLIAPTVKVDDLVMTTEERVNYLGELVGKEKEAKEATLAYFQLADENKQKLMDAGITDKEITVIEGPYIFGEKYGRGSDVVYNFLGFKAPEKLQKEFDAGNYYIETSMEVLHEYCGDYILRSVYDGAEDLSANVVWNNIDAVKNGNVIEIDFNQFFARDIYVMSKQITYITEALLETAK